MKSKQAFALLLALVAALDHCASKAFDLQGHRVVRGLAPENPLPSFERAMERGVATLELDAAFTRDGVIVIHQKHAPNPNFARDAKGLWLAKQSRPIRQMTLAEVKAHDIGRLKPGGVGARSVAGKVPMDGIRVPRLAELFEMVQRMGNHQIRSAIETKRGPLTPDETQASEPFATALVAGLQHSEYGSVPKMMRAAGGQIWSAYHGDADAALAKQVQALSLKALVWTVNDAPTMNRVIDMGADGLITDRPDIARAVLAARDIVP